MGSEFPGVRAFGFMQRVQRDQLAAFVAAQRSVYGADFTIQSSGMDPELAIICLLSELGPQQSVLGLDIRREPVRRAALELAVRTGLPAMSGVVQLVPRQGTQRKPGYLLVKPVFRHGANGLDRQSHETPRNTIIRLT